MEIFCNRERPNYEEIVSYGPRWLTEYREMDANYKYAGWTLDLMAYWLERIINNEFPAYADEKTIGMWERVLRIERDPAMSLEERRRIVEAYLAGPGKMSRSTIKALAVAYTGQDCDVYWVGERLRVQFDSGEGITISVATLRKILRRRLPAHISYVVNERVIIPMDSRELWRFLLKNIDLRVRIPFFSAIIPGGSENYNPKTGLVVKEIGITVEEGIDLPVLLMGTGCPVLEEMRCIRPAHRFGIDTLNLVDPDTGLPKLKTALYIDGREERIDVAVSVVRRNSWRFDGEIIMDGSRLFNSLFEEEVL